MPVDAAGADALAVRKKSDPDSLDSTDPDIKVQNHIGYATVIAWQ